MEDAIVQSIEKLIYNKILLYDDLLHCFMEERDSLINLNLNNLWKISKEKEEICSKIGSIRQEIISAINPGMDQKIFNLNQILGLIPRESRPEFHNSFQKLIGLKSEIEALRKENMTFMDDSLRFLDEMILTITGEPEARVVYNDKCYLSKPGTNFLLSREV